MYELPPILKGSERQQIASLRDYLVRMSRSLEAAQLEQDAPATAEGVSASPAAVTVAGAGSGNRQSSPVSSEDLAAMRQNTARLKSLIVKTAEDMDSRVTRLYEALEDSYVARSEFGTYAEIASSSARAEARQIVESFEFRSLLEAVNSRFGGVDRHLTSLDGEIRRGCLTDPDTGELIFGIAIAENLSFTGEVVTENGLVYGQLSPGQTLGLYTANGWQFWQSGARRGWFDAADGLLHLTGLSAADSLRLGGGWLVTAADGLGIKYCGV